LVLSRNYRQNPRCAMTWYHYLWNEMAAPKGQFAGNRIAFVTLNYDRSLERYFFLRLKAKHQYGNDEECLLFGIRFVQSTAVSVTRASRNILGGATNRFLMKFKEPPTDWIIHEETTGTESLSQAVDLIQETDILCFLGYGFHTLNNHRLTLDQMTFDRSERQKWFTSRYGMTEVEFCRRTGPFLNRFFHGGYMTGRVGDESDGALEVLRKLPVIE
jgi:hypothetical protein